MITKIFHILERHKSESESHDLLILALANWNDDVTEFAFNYYSIKTESKDHIIQLIVYIKYFINKQVEISIITHFINCLNNIKQMMIILMTFGNESIHPRHRLISFLDRHSSRNTHKYQICH